MTNIHSLSTRHNGIANQIITDVEIKNPETGVVILTKAIWDTGAQKSVVTEETAKNAGLILASKAIVSGVHGPKIVNRYFVNITLNNKSVSLDLPVTECSSLSPDESIGALIGMDVINRGDFAITNFKGNTVMSFRVPSMHEIDFGKNVTSGKQNSNFTPPKKKRK